MFPRILRMFSATFHYWHNVLCINFSPVSILQKRHI